MRSRKQQGQALIEMAVACLFLIPIVLGLLDVTTLVLCNMVNDSTAKTAARAAANQPNENDAKAAAQRAVKSVYRSSIIADVSLKDIKYTGKKESVTVLTAMDVVLPVQFPGMITHQMFVAQSIQPIVAQ